MLKAMLDVVLTEPIAIVDLGAYLTPSKPRYQPLVDLGLAKIIGVEPLQSGGDAFVENLVGKAKVFKVLIGDGKKQTFHVCRLETCSSVFEPNFRLADMFHAFSENLQVMTLEERQTERLDDILGGLEVDLIKCDIQGSEMLALSGGNSTFGKSLVLDMELEMIEQYLGQPRFSEFEIAVRPLGFQFHTFLGYGTRAYKPLVLNGNRSRGIKQWLWTECVFIKSPLIWNSLSVSKLFKLAVIADVVYQSYDIAAACFVRAFQQGAHDYLPQYVEGLNEQGIAVSLDDS